jgi:hypothetical protein
MGANHIQPWWRTSIPWFDFAGGALLETARNRLMCRKKTPVNASDNGLWSDDIATIVPDTMVIQASVDALGQA